MYYDNNDYNRNMKPTEVSYYPAEDDEPKKKHHYLLKTLAAIACVAAISAASISGYIAYADYVGQSAPPGEAHGQNQTTVSQQSETAVTGVKTDEAAESTVSSDSTASAKSLIELASKENALTVPEIVQKVTPSVVGITATTPLGTATGSGIIMTDDGYIITNAHVVEDATAVSVLLSDESEYNAAVIGADYRTDIAVLKINSDKKLTAAEFGSSDALVVGELAIVIGNPLGFDFYGSVTSGIISGLNRELTIEDKTLNLIQTDAAINGGNSGGPLVNSYGQVVGISSARVSTTVAEGMGFAIPINEAIPIIDDLIKNGYVTGRPLIGITGFDVDERTSQYYNMPQGIYIAQLAANSPASNAGLMAGDVIVAINGKSISTMDELNSIKNQYKPGDTVVLTVSRNGQQAQFNVILGEEK